MLPKWPEVETTLSEDTFFIGVLINRKTQSNEMHACTSFLWVALFQQHNNKLLFFLSTPIWDQVYLRECLCPSTLLLLLTVKAVSKPWLWFQLGWGSLYKSLWGRQHVGHSRQVFVDYPKTPKVVWTSALPASVVTVKVEHVFGCVYDLSSQTYHSRREITDPSRWDT